MRGKFPFLSVLFLALAGLTATAAAEDCYDDVCVDFSDIGGYYLLTATDADDGSPLEVQMTDIPSSIPPGGGSTPPTDPYSLPDSGKSVPAPNTESSTDTITKEFPSRDGTWIVNITVTYDGDGNVIDVDANVIFVPHENEQQ